MDLLPTDWRDALRGEFDKPYFAQLQQFIDEEYEQHQIFPPQHLIFRALELSPIERIKVVILGQDPYHDVDQAHGLCFSVNDGVRVPPSLRNMFKEIEAQMGTPPPTSGNLERWAEQGVLLLNAVLTVRAHTPESHAKRGWEQFTDAIIEAVTKDHSGVVYMLWGNYARKKGARIDPTENCILMAAHPSPLSFRHRAKDPEQFTAANEYLTQSGCEAIEW
ncbi:MAG: uracil-DNA glycosylase [Rikenellaceae bacterium]